MNTRQLMETLVEQEDTLIEALVLSLRNIKYGKGEFAFFNSNMELVALLDYLVGSLEEDTSNVYRVKKQVIDDFKETDEVNQDALTRLENAVFSEVKTCLNLLANIAKAKESVEFQELWKEKRYGNSEERHDTDGEV